MGQKMNWRTFEYIVAVKETGSVQQTAKRCNATIGTISGQISRLEKYLGVRIFDSRGYPACLDPDALEIYQLISDIVQNLSRIKKLAEFRRRTNDSPETV